MIQKQTEETNNQIVVDEQESKVVEPEQSPETALVSETQVKDSSTSNADIQVTPPDIFAKIGAVPIEEMIRWMKSLVFGEPGAGKTTLGGSAGESELTSPGLILDIDGGLMSIRHYKGLMVKQVRGLDELKQTFADIHSAIDWSDPNDPKLPFKFLMVDSLTELQKIDMQEIMAGTKAVIEGRQDPYVPSEREWFISQGHMREIVRKFRDLPCHILFTAHLDPKKDTKNRMVNGPDLPGKLRNQVSGFFDVVGYLYATIEDGTAVRKLQVAKTDTTIAKDRLNVLGQVVVNPTFPMLVEKLNIQGEVK